MKHRTNRGHWGEAVAKLLPGDHIHHVAPSLDRRASAPTSVRLAVIDAAAAKRRRKAAQRLKAAK